MKGGVHFISVYMKDGGRVSDTNQAVLTELAALVGSIRGPWVIGGDWNFTPQQLRDTNWLQIVNGVIKAPARDTCNGKVYDFFVVHSSLDEAVVGTVRVEDGGLSPHWPARMYMTTAVRHKAVRRMVKPTNIPATLPFGPNNQPPTAKQFSDEGTTGLDRSFSNWYGRAREAWHALLGTPPKATTHRFRWEAATGRTAARATPAS